MRNAGRIDRYPAAHLLPSTSPLIGDAMTIRLLAVNNPRAATNINVVAIRQLGQLEYCPAPNCCGFAEPVDDQHPKRPRVRFSSWCESPLCCRPSRGAAHDRGFAPGC